MPVRGVDDLQRLMDAERIGVSVRLELFRDGEARAASVRPVELDALSRSGAGERQH